MKIQSLSQRLWLVMSTIAITGGFFAYYFLVYMKDRQIELEAKKFRELNQYAENIKEGFREHTKRSIRVYGSFECIPPGTLEKARLEVIKPIVQESDFSELLFEVESAIEYQTFANIIDPGVVQSILSKENAGIVRQVEFRINNENYLIFIHEFNLGDVSWRIFGFYVKDQFMSQVRSVNLIYAVGASLFLIIILLMMPLLKLWIMNELEKLRTVNVWFCGFSLVVGGSFLLLILLMANDFFASYNSFPCEEIAGECDLSKNRNARVRVLSDSIESKFTKELRSIYNEIQECKGKYDLIKGNENGTNIMRPNALLNPPIKFTAYSYFNEVLWLNGDGSSAMVMATHGLDSNDVLNIGDRKYFSQALHDSTWIMPDATSGRAEEKFVLQSIQSYISNLHEVGFGTKLHGENGDAKVLAIATKLHTVMDPLLPPGYQFVVIDRMGKVWFHSKTDKNLKENFFDETGWDKKLMAAIKGRSSTGLDINYDHSNHRSFIRPIRNTDLHLIVLHDHDFFNTPIVLTVGLASFLVFILLIIQGIHQLILLSTTYRFSLLKINRFFLAWLRPQKEKMAIYRKAVLVQLLLLVPIAIITLKFHPVCLIICFFTLPIFLHVYHFFSLERVTIQRGWKEQHLILWIHPFLFASGLLVLFINFSGYYYLVPDNFEIVAVVQVLIILTLLAAYLWKPSEKVKRYLLRYRILLFGEMNDFDRLLPLTALSSKQYNILKRWRRKVIRPRPERFENWYYRFLFLWLILASILPTYYFYKIGYYEEGKVWMRYVQLTAAQNQEQRDLHLKNELSGVFGEQVEEMKKLGDYLDVNQEIVYEKSIDTFSSLKHVPFQDLLFNAPTLSGQAELSRAAIYPAAGDNQWTWYEKGFSNRLQYKTYAGDVRYYESRLLPFRLFKGDYWIILLVIIALSVLILYRTLRFCVTHIFGLGLLTMDQYKVPKLFAGSRYFIVGMPHSGKSKLVEEIKKESKINGPIVYVDLNAGPVPVIPIDCPLVIATNFHLDLNNHQSNQEKLEKMDAFKKFTQVPVIIVSNLEPATVLEFYDKLASYYHKEKGDYELDGNFRKCKQAYRKWKNMLSGYSIHYHALKKERQFEDKYIKYELNHGDYLPQHARQLNLHISNTREQEEMVLQVEELSQLYYQALWNCLSSAEKFLLYDLAKDPFVNMRNMKTVRVLRQKGILIMKNSLHIMNKSFNNFILSIVKEDDEMKMEEEMRKRGSWNTLHLILVIAIVSIIVFLGIAQQELFKNFQAILAATAALLPLLARFGGMFTGTKMKE